jgi:hypothetical protein
MLVPALILALGCSACHGEENRDWFTKKCPLLEKIHVKQFSAVGETRAQVVKKINQALREASPATRIKILFIPPAASLGIDESKYARSIHIEVHDIPVTQLLRYMTMFDVEWKIVGNEIVGTQASTD